MAVRIRSWAKRYAITTGILSNFLLTAIILLSSLDPGNTVLLRTNTYGELWWESIVSVVTLAVSFAGSWWLWRDVV